METPVSRLLAGSLYPWPKAEAWEANTASSRSAASARQSGHAHLRLLVMVVEQPPRSNQCRLAYRDRIAQRSFQQPRKGRMIAEISIKAGWNWRRGGGS